MTINEGYYIAECSSLNNPVPHKELDTYYIPFDISKRNVELEEDGETVSREMYFYKEYRFNTPINYSIPSDLVEIMANILVSSAKE